MSQTEPGATRTKRTLTIIKHGDPDQSVPRKNPPSVRLTRSQQDKHCGALSSGLGETGPALESVVTAACEEPVASGAITALKDSKDFQVPKICIESGSTESHIPSGAVAGVKRELPRPTPRATASARGRSSSSTTSEETTDAMGGALQDDMDMSLDAAQLTQPLKRSNSQPTPRSVRVLRPRGLPSSTKSSQPPQQESQPKSFTFNDCLGSPLPSLKPKPLIIYPPACLGHETMGHQESTERLRVLCGPQGALRRVMFEGVQWAGEDVKPACIADILRVHEYEYLRHLERLCRALPNAAPACDGANGMAAKPLAMRLLPKDVDMLEDGPAYNHNVLSTRSLPIASPRGRPFPSHGGGGPLATEVHHGADEGFLDVDTRLSRKSLEAAKIAAGAVIEAVDCAAQGRNRRVFVAVRPPGHHAGPRGAVPSTNYWKAPGMCSSGFCLLNSVAIGAAYARNRYGRAHGPFKRVAIIDIDIHHGNGTEEIVKCLRPQRRTLPLPSSWAPQTYEMYKPWLDTDDAQNVFFGSVQLVDGLEFYPCSGSEVENDLTSNIINVELTPIRTAVPPNDQNKNVKNSKKTKDHCAKASAEFRDRISWKLLPPLRAFAPDLLFISAGFDGHADDKVRTFGCKPMLARFTWAYITAVSRVHLVALLMCSVSAVFVETVSLADGRRLRVVRYSVMSLTNGLRFKSPIRYGKDVIDAVSRLTLRSHTDAYPWRYITPHDRITRELLRVVDSTDGAIISVLEGGYHTHATPPPPVRNSGRSNSRKPHNQASPPPQTPQPKVGGEDCNGGCASGGALDDEDAASDLVANGSDLSNGSEGPRDGGLPKGCMAHVKELFGLT